jgi:hypothetical protein
MKPWITVGEAVSPDGTRLELVEHDGEYIIKADDLPLMLTRVHFSKVELARVVRETPTGRQGDDRRPGPGIHTAHGSRPASRQGF